MVQSVDRKHPITLVIGLGIIAASLLGALYMMRRADARMNAADEDAVDPALTVEVAAVTVGDYPRTIRARGFLSGIEEVTLRSEVNGRLQERAAEEGESVSAGDVLLTIDDTFYTLAVQRARAELQRAKAQQGDATAGITQAEAQLDAADAVRKNRTDEFERIAGLYEQGNSPQIEYDRVHTALRTAEADYEAAKAALARVIDQQSTAQALVAVADAALSEAQAHLDRCKVHAPFDGRVNRYFIEPGEYAAATAPLVELVRLDRMKMNAALSDTEVPLLDEFERAEVTADAGERVHTAMLHHVAPKVDPLTKRFQVELQVENDDEELLSGMYGEAVLFCGKYTDRIRLPRVAVFKHYGVDHCLVVEQLNGEHVAALRQVDVRNVIGRLDEVEVISGLSPGEQVITSRRRELHDGVRVEFSKTRGPDAAGGAG